MKHRQKLQQDIEILDNNFNSRGNSRAPPDKAFQDESRVDQIVMMNSTKKDECKDLLFPEFARKKASHDLSVQTKGILKNSRSQSQSMDNSCLIESRKISSSKIDMLIESNKCQQFQIESLKLENQKKIEDLSKKIYKLSSKKNSVVSIRDSLEKDYSNCSKDLNFGSFEEVG